MNNLLKFIQNILSRTIAIFRITIKNNQIHDTENYSNRMIELNTKCRKDFGEFVNIIQNMPLYFLSQY
jgi:hypothetical protein